jgi:hypothetical protein
MNGFISKHTILGEAQALLIGYFPHAVSKDKPPGEIQAKHQYV